MRQRWADYRVFWREFRQQYHTTGALLPSGKALSRALASFVRNNGAGGGRRILEVGPGTGAVTGQIIAAMRPDDRLTLVERNDQFVAQLRVRLADDPKIRSITDRITVIHASVEDLPENKPFDLIISGLPLNNFAVETVEQILSKLRRLLATNGTLSYFEYVAVRRAKLLVSPQQRERLRGISRVFDELLGAHEVRRDLVLTNVPPAWVHHVRFAAGSKERGAQRPAPGSPPLAPSHNEPPNA